MARVPVITSPCPLRFNNMPTTGLDFCGQCRRRVHNLDGMSDAQRSAFFASCSGDVCVAYSVRRSPALAGVVRLGMAAGVALTGGTALAQNSAVAGAASESAAPIPTVVTGPVCDPNAKSQALDFVFVGGTTNAAQWIDDSELSAPARPEIEEIAATEWLPNPPGE